MEGSGKETKWLSINIDDSTSDLMPSFESALNDKSLYIIERKYSSSSGTGKTDYFKYDIYSIDGEKIQLKVGNCKVVGEIVEGWHPGYDFNNLINFDDDFLKTITWLYPFSKYYNYGCFCFLKISDEIGITKTIGFHSYTNNFWQIFKEFSRAGNWDKFILNNTIRMISKEINYLNDFTTKYGYSKIEFGFEYGWISIEQIDKLEIHIKNELAFVQDVLRFCNKNFDPIYLEEEKYTIGTIEDKIEFINKILLGKKPWRRHYKLL